MCVIQFSLLFFFFLIINEKVSENKNSSEKKIFIVSTFFIWKKKKDKNCRYSIFCFLIYHYYYQFCSVSWTLKAQTLPAIHHTQTHIRKLLTHIAVGLRFRDPKTFRQPNTIKCEKKKSENWKKFINKEKLKRHTQKRRKMKKKKWQNEKCTIRKMFPSSDHYYILWKSWIIKIN